VTITVIPLVALYLLTRRMLARGLMEGGQR
jgi:hypothetical protein